MTRQLSWEAKERLRMAERPPAPAVTDDLTKVIGLLDKMLTDYHESRPRGRRLRRSLP